MQYEECRLDVVDHKLIGVLNWKLCSITAPNNSLDIYEITKIKYDFIVIANLTTFTNLITIGDSAFGGKSHLKKVYFPPSLKHIGKEAFSWCTSVSGYADLKNIVSIGSEAFRNCERLTGSLDFQNEIEIHDFTFFNCRALSFTLNLKKIISIGEYAFAGCINIKGDLDFSGKDIINSSAFSGCSSLTGPINLSRMKIMHMILHFLDVLILAVH